MFKVHFRSTWVRLATNIGWSLNDLTELLLSTVHHMHIPNIHTSSRLHHESAIYLPSSTNNFKYFIAHKVHRCNQVVLMSPVIQPKWFWYIQQPLLNSEHELERDTNLCRSLLGKSKHERQDVFIAGEVSLQTAWSTSGDNIIALWEDGTWSS